MRQNNQSRYTKFFLFEKLQSNKQTNELRSNFAITYLKGFNLKEPTSIKREPIQLMIFENNDHSISIASFLNWSYLKNEEKKWIHKQKKWI